MIGKKINQLATELAPLPTDLTIIGDPTTGVSKKITLEQISSLFGGSVSFYTNLAGFPAVGNIDIIYCAKNTNKLYLWSGSAYVEMFPSQALLDTYQLRSEKGNANGYASLDSLGKVPINQLPSSLMEYKGTWNASTNTPTLANGTGDTGDVYICNVAGTVNFGAGPLTFAVGDYVIYSGTIWQRSSGAVGTVTSVAVSRSGDALAITGSPVTTSGTINIGFAGTGAQYIKGDGTLATFPSIISQAQNLVTEVYNSTGATLTKGTVVYINGGQGNLPTVTKALATGDSTSAQTYGIVQADITNMNNGYVVVAGRLSDLDTQAYTEGTQLYLSSTTAGAYTSTKQYAPAHLVYVGIIVRSHPTQGIIEVKIQNGYELDELHNVAAQSPSNGDILQYVSSTSLWTKVSGTTTNIAEGSNLYYTDARSRAALSFTAGSGAYNSTTGVITIPTNTNQLTNGANYITLASLSAGAGISYNNTTGVIASTITQYTDALARAAISLTTSGTSGAATYNSTTGVLNVPQYAPDLSGYVPTSRTLTINGTAYDLSANRSWSVGTVTSVGLSSATSGVTIGSTPITTSGTITLAIATASGSQQGLLSSTDWTTFNNKQNALTNPVTGTGTTNYLPKFTGASTIGNSNILIQGGGFYLAGSEIFTNANGGLFFNGNGSYATGIFGYSSSNNLRIIAPNQVDFYTASTQRMLLDASGNLGLGVTPSAWVDYTGFQIGTQGSIGATSTVINFGQNVYYGASGNSYIANGNAAMYQINDGVHGWRIAGTGTAGNAISFTQAMTLDASGRLGIGTTSPLYRLDVQAAAGVAIRVRNTFNTDDAYFLAQSTLGSGLFGINATGQYLYTGDAIPTLFYNSGTERMRISASGNLSIGNTNNTYKLDVSGSGRFSGDVITSGGNLDVRNSNVQVQFFDTANSNYQYSLQNYSSQFRLYNNNTSTTVLNFASTGAATFSSSVTAGGTIVAGTSATEGTIHFGTGVYKGIMNYSAATGTWTLNNQSSGSGPTLYYQFQADGSSIMSMLKSGNVGIGTTSPNNLLTLYSASSAIYTQWVQSGTGTSSTDGLRIGLDASSNGIINLNEGTALITSIDGTERMRITSGGDIIIGYNQTTTTTIGRTFATTHASANRGATLFYGINDGGFGGMYTYNVASGVTGYNAQYIAFHTHEGAVSSGERMRITSTGVVLIGSTTSLYTDTNRGTLEVNGTSSAIVGLTIGGTNGGYLLHSGTDLNIWNAKNGAAIFGTNNTERMRILNDGTILIGTSTDGFLGKLQVAGSVAITGQYNTVLPSSSFSYFDGSGQVVSSSSNASALYLDTTWNTTGNPDGIYLNVTNTASGSSSKLLNLKVGSVSQFSVSKAGAIQTTAPSSGSAQPWKLGSYAAGGTGTATGVIYIEINGQIYSIPALQGTP
jgi:hypothetical protein